ncbi:MAG: hypothetical protein WA705_18380 [Candidatus Ozemobacteraceae bacterium]
MKNLFPQSIHERQPRRGNTSAWLLLVALCLLQLVPTFHIHSGTWFNKTPSTNFASSVMETIPQAENDCPLCVWFAHIFAAGVAASLVLFCLRHVVFSLVTRSFPWFSHEIDRQLLAQPPPGR